MDISLFPPALQVMITLKGESDPSAADIFVKVGMINFRVGRLERAMPLLNKAIDIYREGGTEYESKLVSPLFVIGNIHKLLKQSKKARGVWSEAYELSTKYDGFKSDKILNKVHLVLQQLIENSDEEEEKEEEEEESVKKLPADTDTVPKRESTETGSNEVEQKKEKKENKKKTSPADTDIVEISTDDAEKKKKEKSKKKPVSEQSEAVEDRNDNSVEVEKKKEKSKKKSSSAKSEKVEERNGNGDEVEKKKVKSKKREKSKKKKSSADTEASS